jgi:basic membrane protein A
MWWRNVEGVEGLKQTMKQRQSYFLACILVLIGILAGCGNTTPDDTAVNNGKSATKSQDTTKQDSLQESNSKGISNETIKVGVLYISDPDEGSGYSYTHDLGIIGMQDNLDLSADQIERKIVDDVEDRGYTIQVYANDRTGNIKRSDRTVLVRFYVDEDYKSICFSFAKADAPYEFGYDAPLTLPLDEDIEMIANQSHKDAVELFKVFEKINQEYK